MSELGRATPEQLAAFEQKLRENPALIGELLTRAIENGTLLLPDDTALGITAEELQKELQGDAPSATADGTDFTASL